MEGYDKVRNIFTLRKLNMKIRIMSYIKNTSIVKKGL